MSREGQCGTCGHISRDWSAAGRQTNELGHKIGSSQLPDYREDRISAYRLYRRTIKQAGATDFDQVEWRFGAVGDPYPVALFEMSRVDGNRPVPETYLGAVRKRILIRDWQGRFAIAGACLLGCKAWIVLFRHDLTEFWVYNLTDDRGWWNLTPQTYEGWLNKLGVGALS